MADMAEAITTIVEGYVSWHDLGPDDPDLRSTALTELQRINSINERMRQTLGCLASEGTLAVDGDMSDADIARLSATFRARDRDNTANDAAYESIHRATLSHLAKTMGTQPLSADIDNPFPRNFSSWLRLHTQGKGSTSEIAQASKSEGEKGFTYNYLSGVRGGQDPSRRAQRKIVRAVIKHMGIEGEDVVSRFVAESNFEPPVEGQNALGAWLYEQLGGPPAKRKYDENDKKAVDIVGREEAAKTNLIKTVADSANVTYGYLIGICRGLIRYPAQETIDRIAAAIADTKGLEGEGRDTFISSMPELNIPDEKLP